MRIPLPISLSHVPKSAIAVTCGHGTSHIGSQELSAKSGQLEQVPNLKAAWLLDEDGIGRIEGFPFFWIRRAGCGNI